MGILDAPALPGVNANDAGYDIVILAGQSNMSGRGADYNTVTLDPADPRVWQYGNSSALANQISVAVEPLLMHDTPTGIGPGLVFARWYAATVPPNRRVLLVPVAHGGTSITVPSQWDPDTPTGGLYANLISQAQGALTAAGENARIVAMLWLQGETDGDNGTTGATYQTKFEKLIDNVRTTLALPDLPVVIGQMCPEYLPIGTRAPINAIHIATPGRKAKTAFATSPVNLNNNDGNHFNGVAQRIIGRSLFSAFRRIKTGTADPTLPAVPGQPTAVTASSVTTTAMTLSWTLGARTAVHYVERKLTSGSTWTRIGTPTSATLAVSGMVSDTSYDFRITPINASGPGTVSTTFTVSTASTAVTVMGVSAVLDSAYSLRKLNAAYTGSAIRVRRSSDNTQQDIGFVSNALDTSALLAFAGSGDAFVTTLYDQSPNGKNLAQATAAAQPTIVLAGAVLTSGGKPAMQFDGVDDVLSRTPAGLYAGGAMTAAGVLLAATPAAQCRWWSESVAAASTPQYGLQQPDATASRQFARPLATNAVVSADAAFAGTVASFNGAIHQLSATDSGTAFAQWVDGATDLASAAYTRSATYLPGVFDTFAIGGVIRAGSLAPLAMKLSEAVYWPSVLSTGNRQTIEANQKAFFATP